MTESEKIAIVKAMTGETDDSTVSAFLKLAGASICRAAFPYDATVTEVPEEYAHTHVKAAAYMLNKRGAEGELSHSENGVSRAYETGDLPDSILREIVPKCGVTAS